MDDDDEIKVAMPRMSSTGEKREQTAESEASLPTPPYATIYEQDWRLENRKRVGSISSEASSDNIVVKIPDETEATFKIGTPSRRKRAPSSTSSSSFGMSMTNGNENRPLPPNGSSMDVNALYTTSSEDEDDGTDDDQLQSGSNDAEAEIDLLEHWSREKTKSAEHVDTPVCPTKPGNRTKPMREPAPSFFNRYAITQRQAETSIIQAKSPLQQRSVLPPSAVPSASSAKRKKPVGPIQEDTSSEEETPPPAKKPQFWVPERNEAQRAESKRLRQEGKMRRSMSRAGSEMPINPEAWLESLHQSANRLPPPQSGPVQDKLGVKNSSIPQPSKPIQGPTATMQPLPLERDLKTATRLQQFGIDKMRSMATPAQATDKARAQPTQNIPVSVPKITKPTEATRDSLSSIIAAAGRSGSSKPLMSNQSTTDRGGAPDVARRSDAFEYPFPALQAKEATKSQQPARHESQTRPIDFGEKQRQLRQENSRRQLEALRANLREGEERARREELAKELEKEAKKEAERSKEERARRDAEQQLQEAERMKQEELTKRAAKKAREDAERVRKDAQVREAEKRAREDAATSERTGGEYSNGVTGANQTPLGTQSRQGYLSLPGGPRTTIPRDIPNGRPNSSKQNLQPPSLAKKCQDLENIDTQDGYRPQPMSLSKRMQMLQGNARAKDSAGPLGENGHGTHDSEQGEDECAVAKLDQVERAIQSSIDRAGSEETVDQCTEQEQPYQSLTKRFMGTTGHITARDLAKAAQQKPFAAGDVDWATSEAPRASSAFRARNFSTANGSFSDARCQAEKRRTYKRKLGEITSDDIRVVLWREQGNRWDDVLMMFHSLTGKQRSVDFLRRRHRQVEKALDLPGVTPVMLERAKNKDAEALRALNVLVRGGEATPPLESQSPLTIRPPAATNRYLSCPISAVATPIPRQTTAGKQLSDDAVQAYYAGLIEDMAEGSYSSDSESERESSPFTEADRVHFAYKVERRQLLEDDNQDCEIDDLLWYQVGETYESNTEAKVALSQAIFMCSSHEEAVVSPDQDWSIHYTSNTGDNDIICAQTAQSSTGEVQVRVRRFLRTFQMGRLPSSKDCWLPKTVYFVKERSTLTEGNGIFEAERVTNETKLVENTAFGAMDMANVRAGERVLEISVRPRSTDMRQFDAELSAARCKMEQRIAQLEERGECFMEKIKGDEEGGGTAVVEIWVEAGEFKGPRNL